MPKKPRATNTGPNDSRTKAAKERAAKMKALHDTGLSCRAIGKRFGDISSQRVQQILDKYYPATA